MKKCVKCGTTLEDRDLFCISCGTNQNAPNEAVDQGTPIQIGTPTPTPSSTFLKYSGYLDNESLFKVALAKEQGIVSSAFPTEAEEIYQTLAFKNHLESMFRLAMVKLNKRPAETQAAAQWLQIASEKGHIASTNYLRTMMPEYTKTSFRPATVAQPTHTPAASNTSGTGGILTGEDIFAKMQDCVVEIIATDRKKTARASGFLVSSTGFIITNAHAVLDENGNVYETVRVKRGDEVVTAAVVAVGKPVDGKHDSVDLALLFALDLMNKGCSDLGTSSSCRNGQKVYLIGNSLGSGTCITSGIISDATRSMPGLSYPYVMTDAAANQGNSGGPLLSEDGKVIGVLVSGIQNAEGMNYAIPIDVTKEFLAYVVRQSKFQNDILAEISDSIQTNVTMSSVRDKIFAGIHLALDVIAFILSIL